VAAPGWSVVALARHRLGKPEAAREALGRAAALLEVTPAGRRDPDGEGWLDVFIAEVLHREAEEVILGKTAGKN
jgi:hypothetical protein